jgi:hypothetical protein
MRGQRRTEYECEWHVSLKPERAGAASHFFIAGWKQQAKPGSEHRACFRIPDELVAVVQGKVAEPSPRAIRVLQRNGVAELVGDSAEGPLLSKSVPPTTPGRPGKGVNVLDYTSLLVVGLFQEETVVLYLSGKRWRKNPKKDVSGKR